MFTIYIILVNYNNALDTIECLESLLKLKDAKYKIIVVDNSTGEDFNAFKEWAKGSKRSLLATSFPEILFPIENAIVDASFFNENDIKSSLVVRNSLVTFIKANRNNGFAAANNIGIKYVRNLGESFFWTWILNNDTIVSDNLLSSFRSLSSQLNLNITGIVGTKVFYYHDPNLLQAICGRYNPYNGKTKHIGSFKEDAGQFDNYIFKKYDYVIGASMFVSSNYLNEVGMMSEEYFLYYEEIDWIVRGYKNNWKIAFLSNGKVYHKEGASINSDAKKKNDMADYYICRNILLLTRKNLRFYLLSIKFSLVLRLIIRLFTLKFGRAKAIYMFLKSANSLKRKFNES